MHSVITITHCRQLLEHARQLLSFASTQSTRALLVVLDISEQAMEDFSNRINSLYVPAKSTTDRADSISKLLGSERQLACIHLAQQPDFGLLAALAGTIHSGGLLVIGISAASNSQTFDAPRVATAISHSRSTARFIRLAQTSALTEPESMHCLTLPNALLCNPMPSAEQPGSILSMLASSSDSPRFAGAFTNNLDAVAEQDALYAQACNHWDNLQSSCIVIRGRRGRGKSHLLARLATHLQQKSVSFYITARQKSAVLALRKSLDSAAKHYLSPELAIGGSAQALLVDEAADFSIAQLKTFLTVYPHVLLCTTTEGYENAGRAFDLRLLESWTDCSKPLLQLVPRHPWRWQMNDPMERFIDKLCLSVSTTEASDDRYDSTCLTPIAHPQMAFRIRQVDRDELTHNETLLHGIHKLLFTSHYQSTTKDLGHLLDAPTLELWIQENDSRVVAVLWLEREGGIERSLAEPIVSKRRRLPNQLLPQLLAQMADDSRALGKQYIRVVRIAVIPSLRRQGLASQLLQAVIRASKSEEAEEASQRGDAIGASFSSDTVSRSFWCHHGFQEFHHGYRVNPRTGKKAISCLRALEPCCAKVLAKALYIHTENVRARSTVSDVDKTTDPLSAIELNLLVRFSEGQRSEHDTVAAIKKVLAANPASWREADRDGQKSPQLRLQTHISEWLKRYGYR